MKIGRNDPCPCGSGKKYKKCCLEKDEKAASAARAEMPRAQDPPSLPAAPPPFETPEPSRKPQTPPDPKTAAIDARWEEFENQDYEGRIELFRRTLDDEELMDEQMAFEMLSEIDDAAECGERDRFASLVTELRERRPEVYEPNAPSYVQWMIADAVADSRFDAIPALAAEIAGSAGRDIDTFNNVLDLLAYHGRLDTLVEMMRAAWSLVRQSNNIVSWGVDEFAEKAARYEIYRYAERAPSPDPDDPELASRIGFYAVDVNAVAGRWTRLFIGPLTVATRKDWASEDFDFPNRRKAPRDIEEDEASGESDGRRDNLLCLMAEFVNYLRSTEGVPYAKGDMAARMLHQYLLERRDGELEPRLSMIETVLRPGKKPPKERRDPVPFPCPDAITLDRYLGSLIGFINAQYHKTAATFELMPAWLRFLASRRLIDAPLQEKTLREMGDHLLPSLLRFFEGYRRDPAIFKALERWPENASRER